MPKTPTSNITRKSAWMLIVASLLGSACSRAMPFAGYQRETFPETAITQSVERTIVIPNPHGDAPQHIRAIGFDAGGNVGKNFTLKSVTVAGKTFAPKEITIPANAAMELHIEYSPRNLETTVADFGGVETGAPTRFISHAPKVATLAFAHNGARSAHNIHANNRAQLALLGVNAATLDRADASATLNRADEISTATENTTDSTSAIHRALLVMTYDQPDSGMTEIELVGSAVPGPNGETTSSGSSGGGGSAPGTCAPNESTACFAGDLGITLPGLVDKEITVPISGPWTIHVESGSVTAPMVNLPPAVIVVEGPAVEALHINAVTLAISGDPASEASGTFDGSALSLTNVGFRVRVYIAKISVADLESTATFADFSIPNLTMSTLEPLAGTAITLGVETTLSQTPSGNEMLDGKLGGLKVKLTLTGNLEGPKS